MPYMYILECADGSYYTGSTWNLEKRIWEHQNGLGARHTAKRLPVNLVYCEECDRIDDAFYREKQVQGWSRKKKEALMAGDMNQLHLLAVCQNESHSRNVGFGSAQPTDYSAHSTDCSVQATDCSAQATDCSAHSTDCSVQATDCSAQPTGGPTLQPLALPNCSLSGVEGNTAGSTVSARSLRGVETGKRPFRGEVTTKECTFSEYPERLK